jgi:predicted DNA-binding ArsR family transcriptional regulator
MDSAKRCWEQSAECLSLMRSAQSETEAKLLKDLAQSWLRIANQMERYCNFVGRTGQPAPTTGFPKIHSEPKNLRF